VGSLAERANAITSAPTSGDPVDTAWGAPLGELRRWLDDRGVALPAMMTEVAPAHVDSAVDSGARLLVLRSDPAEELHSRAVVAVLTGAEPNALVPQPAGMPDATWMQQVIAVRDAAADVRAHLGDPEALVGSSATLTAMTEALVTACIRCTPVFLEGLTAWTAALAADRLSFRAKTWWFGAGSSSDPAISAAALRIGIPTGLDLRLPTESVIGARVHAAVTNVD